MEYSIYILFWLYKSKLNDKGTAPIYLRITVNGKKAEISTGLYVPMKLWDAKKGQIKGSTNEVKEMNKKMEVLKVKALKIFNELTEMDIPVSADQIKEKLNNNQGEAKTILEALAYHNQLLKSRVGFETSKATYTKYETLRRKVTTFIQEHLKRKDIFLKELNHQFVLQFETYLKVSEKISHNPTIKYIQFLKKIIHLSVANGWINSNPFKNFKCSLIEKERGYLTANELQTIKEKEINIKRLDSVRDIFVFSCYTGLAYSDIKKVRYKDLQIKDDGSKWIVIHRTKTGTRSAIPLLPQAKAVMEKYEPPFIPDNNARLLPVLSNQKMNAYLKEIATVCGFDKNLTFHLARHTFATTVTLTNGVPIETVSKMLGHTNLKTTQIYAKVIDTKIQKDMQVLLN